MRRHSFLAAVVVGLGVAIPANAQSRSVSTPPRDADLQRIRAEVEKVRAEISVLEARLQRMEAAGSRVRQPGFTTFGGPTMLGGGGGITSGLGGFGATSFGSGGGFGGTVSRAGLSGTQSRGFGGSSGTAERRPGPSGPQARGPQGPSRDEFNRRLDRIIRELEQLRSEMRDRPR